MPENESASSSGRVPAPSLDFRALDFRALDFLALDFRAAARVLDAVRRDDGDRPAHGDALSIAGYTIELTLGEGAGGAVYRARRDGSEQPVALKFLHHRLGSSAAAQRAWRELDILSQLRLPSLPRLLDHGIADGRLFIATEFIEGLPPTAHCAELGLDRRARVELIARIADAVQSLHERGVIHRDLKPSNILVDANGQVVIVDLGIATLLDHSVGATVTVDGTPVGTPAFMSPEQARGDSGAISTRSDVYGLGASAYLLLTAETPHQSGAIHDTVRRVAFDAPRDPRALDPSLPKGLAAVLLKAVAREPSERYASAAEFAADLRRWLAGRAVEAGGISVAQRIGRWVARHPIVVTTALASLIVVTSVVTALGVNWRYNREPTFLELDTTGIPAIVLRARSGNELHRWTASRIDARIRSKAIVEGPDGSGRFALIAFGDWGGPLSHRIALFDTRKPSVPIWSTETSPTSVGMPPAISRQGLDAHFVADLRLIDNFFPEEPSPQFALTLTNGGFSASCVQIVGFNGRTLYEFWHDGAINEVGWIEHERILLVTACNSEGTVQQRGLADSLLRNIPIAFAVRPVHGEIEKQWIRFEGGHGSLEPLWYRALQPLSALGDIDPGATLEIETTLIGIDPSNRGVTLTVSFGSASESPPCIFLSIDPRSGETLGTNMCDRYVAARVLDPERFPDPSVFHLGDVPPAAPRPDR